MKLWIDDIRKAPDGWTHAKTPHEAIDILNTHNVIEAVSFDHDLGVDQYDNPLDSRCIVNYMITNGIEANNYHVHTANPVGREWLVGMIERYLGKVTQ